MSKNKKAQLLNGDSTINTEHNLNTHGLNVDVNKEDVAQIYVVQIKQKLNAKKAKLTEEFETLEQLVRATNEEADGLINSLVAKAVKKKADAINKAYSDLKADIKALVKKASSTVDKNIGQLFNDTEEIDSRIKYNLDTPSIKYNWRSAKVAKEDGTGEKLVINISLSIDGHTEVKALDVPSNIMALKTTVMESRKSMETLTSQLQKINNELNNTGNLKEAAEAAVAAAKLNQSEFGKQCLESLNGLFEGGGLLKLGTSKED
jgi:hypothetical protein